MLGGDKATWKLFLLGGTVSLLSTHSSQPWAEASIHLAAVQLISQNMEKTKAP